MEEFEVDNDLESDSSQPDRSYKALRTRKRTRWECKATTEGHRTLSYRILYTYQATFDKLGFVLVRKPWFFLFGFLAVLIVSCLGLIRFRADPPLVESFTASSGQSREDLRHASQFFPRLDARQEEIIMTPKLGNNILRWNCLKDALLVHWTVVNISGFHEICLKNLNPNPLQKLAKQPCIISNPLELAEFQFDKLKNLSSILARELKNSSTVLSTGQTFNSSYKEMMGNFQAQPKTSSQSSRADALRVIYFIKSTTDGKDQQKILAFEKSFENLLYQISDRLKCVSLSFNTARTKTDALQNVLKPELWSLCFFPFAMTVLVFIVIHFSSKSLRWSSTMLLMATSILAPLLCSAGIISIAHITFFPTTLFIPFFFMAKGSLDVVHFLLEWERQKTIASLEHRVGICVFKVGYPAVLSTVCGTLLSAVAVKSSFDVIAHFFLATLVVNMVTSVAFVVTAILLISLHKMSQVKSDEPEMEQNQKNKTPRILKALTRIMTSSGGKAAAIIFLVCVFILCTLSALQLLDKTSTIESLYGNDNFKKFKTAQTKFFTRKGDISILFSQNSDYSEPAVQNEMVKICDKLKKSSYSNGVTSCWMEALRKWAIYQNKTCSYSAFYTCLGQFLNQSRNAPIRQDLRFGPTESPFKILASRVHLNMPLFNRYQKDEKSVEMLRKDLLQFDLEPVAVSKRFFDLEDVFLLKQEACIFVFAAATAVVFVISLLSTFNLEISTLLALTMDILLLEAAAVIVVLEIPFNKVSFLSVFATSMITLNFCFQVAYSFVFSARTEIRYRVIDAIRFVGWPVVISWLVMSCGSLSLGFIYPSLGDIFHRLLPLVFALGLIQALVVLPAMIALLTELVHLLSSRCSADSFPTSKEQIDLLPLSIDVRDDNKRQVKSKRPGISIVGISCRFPGASTKDLFWDLLEHGKSFHGAFPKNRTEQHKLFHEYYNPRRFVSGRLCVVNGSYLEDLTQFDNKFFGISDQEARAMDPQQRILLHVVYEAIEDAGMRLEDLQGCRTGVFVGVMNMDYPEIVGYPSNYHNIDQFTAVGNAMSILANRVSFCLNLTGPSIVVDTACSSSLTALKLAADSLHNKECEVAIVCAPNIVLSHVKQMGSSLGGLLAPDGRCKSFDASGDGYGRGEGFAAIVLKLTNAALCDKDDPYCEIIACGVNNDGQNAVPITAPSAKVQAELSKLVLEQSGLTAKDVDYVEAHGTGTAIGDVVEVTSIADVYSRNITSPRRKLRIGSVKSNLNHTESTSGLAGIIKVALMIKNKKYVPTVNVQVLNPKLKLEENKLVVQQTSEPWEKEDGKLRVAAINSFGFGGSNVHLILREITAKQMSHEESVLHRSHVLTLSARSKEALQKMAHQYSEWIKDNVEEMDETFTENLCFSLNERRSRFPYRLAVPFNSTAEASHSLAAFADDCVGWDKLVSYAEASSNNGKFVFMFGGQGSQWYAMGRQLIECEATFRDAVLVVNDLLQNLGATWSLMDELMAPEGDSRISENYIAQPATFAIQYATAKLLMSWKIHPSAVIGHSLGEFAAACTAGIITVKEAVQLVLARSTLQDKCAEDGGMAALGMSEVKARALLESLQLSDTLDIAAVNDADSVTVAGESRSIEILGQHLAMYAKDTFWRILGTKRAFHTIYMEPIKKPFSAAVKRINLNPQLSKIPMYSTVHGEVLSGQRFNGDYWWQNIRSSVQFYPAMKQLLGSGFRQIIEISAQPILAHYVKQISRQEKLEDQETPVVLATLPRRKVPVEDQHKSFLQNTVCQLYTTGHPVDWTCVQKNPSARFVRSLNSPWLEKTFWYDERSTFATIPPFGSKQTEKKPSHPFLPQEKMADPYSHLHCWETEIDIHRFPTLKDHSFIQGGAVMPGAVYLEMAFGMVKDKFANVSGLELSDVKLFSILTLPETQVRCLRLRLQKSSRIDEAKFHITSVQDDESEITLSSGNISIDLLESRHSFDNKVFNQGDSSINELKANMEQMPVESFKRLTEKFGFNYGPKFSLIKKIWQRDNEGFCLIDISESPTIQNERDAYVLHPCILDACLQSCFVALGNLEGEDTSIVPVGFKSVTLNHVPATNQLYCHAIETKLGSFDVRLMSPCGTVLLAIGDFRLAGVTSTQREYPFEELRYEIQWIQEELREKRGAEPRLNCLLLKESSSFSHALLRRLQEANANLTALDPPSEGGPRGTVEEAIMAAINDIPPGNSSHLCVINLWPVEATNRSHDFSVIDEVQSLALHSSVFLMKYLTEKKWHNCQIFLVTERSQMLDSSEKFHGTNSFPWCSTVWGFRRTAGIEDPNFTIKAVDISNKRDTGDVDSLMDEILSESNEEEVVFRDGKRFVNRIVRSEISSEQPTTNAVKSKERATWYLSRNPSSSTICLRENSLSKPSYSEVTIDILHCWTPSESIIDVSRPNGSVFILGKVTDLSGGSLNTLKIGDEVCGIMSSGRVSRTVTVPINNVFVKPTSLTRQQATFVPGSLAIALYALQRAAEAGNGSRKLLIHEANRGPGPAAVVLAKALGHRAFCTISDACRSDTKTVLTEMGAERVINQSSCGLHDDLSHNFDAVVFFYPPSPNLLQKSSRSLKRGGRIIILSSKFQGDVVFNADTNIAYERAEVVDVLRAPQVFQKLSAESVQLLRRTGNLGTLLRIQSVSSKVETAIEVANAALTDPSASSSHKNASTDISFLLYSFPSSEKESGFNKIPILPRGLDDCGLRENRTYLVAGGIRGYGFEVARWMAENGAQSIGLIGRSKPSDAKLQEVRELERRTSTKIHMFQIDISDEDQMLSLKEKLKSLPSVAGIVNSAMVLKDQFIRDFTFESFSVVMGSKIKGSFLLHQMSLDMDLDFFVMFSSIASVLGNMGQTSYAASNHFQDALAEYRRKVLGLPGLAINWGPISGAGVMTRDSHVAKLMTMGGLGFIHAKDGVKYMARILTEEPSRFQLMLCGLDWPRYQKTYEGLRKTPRLSAITAEQSISDNQTNLAVSLVERIVMERDSEKKEALVLEYLVLVLQERTGLTNLSETDYNKNLYSYGIDSTGALILKMHFEAELEVSFEVFYFMQPDTTLIKLSRDVTARLSGQTSSGRPQETQIQESATQPAKAMVEMPHTTTQEQQQVQVVPLYTPVTSAVNFFCVHPFHRYAMNLVPISTGFQGQDLVSFYALGFTDPTAVSEDWGTVRELAAHYVQLIMNKQPHGPYFLGGYSYGGIVAYEMASLLTERNQSVEFLAMIDTFPWNLHTRTISARMVSIQEDAAASHRHVQFQFENHLRKVAVDTLMMTADEYQHLRENNTQDEVMEELQKLCHEKGLLTHDLKALRESLLMNHRISRRTHLEWQPQEVRYRGPLTYLKSQNERFSPWSPTSVEEIWGHLVDGGSTVLVCPGDHFSLSELPNAEVTGSILATAIAFTYRSMFPEIARPTRTFNQRRAVEKLCCGVRVFLHSKNGKKLPHFGELHLQEDAGRLELRSKVNEGEMKEIKKTKKIIDLKDLRMVQPGRIVSSALKFAWRKRRVGAHQSGNLEQVASVITGRRDFNLEFTDYSDLKAFYHMVEAVFAVKLLTS